MAPGISGLVVPRCHDAEDDPFGLNRYLTATRENPMDDDDDREAACDDADGRVGAVASDDDHLPDNRDATLQNTYTGAGHGRAHAGAAGATTSPPGATDAAASNLHRAAADAAGTGASDAIDADAGMCDAAWFARAMEPDVDWSSSASLRAYVLKHDVWPGMGHPLREPMLEAIRALEGVNPDITFSDSAALVPTEGAAEGVGVTAAIDTAARSCLDLAWGAASCCASAAFSCCSAAVSYVSEACTRFFGVFPNGAAKTAVDATSSANGAAASETSYPGDGGATAEPGAAVTEAGGVDALQPFPPSEGEGDEYCETPTEEPAAAARKNLRRRTSRPATSRKFVIGLKLKLRPARARLLCLPATARPRRPTMGLCFKPSRSARDGHASRSLSPRRRL